MNNTLRIGFTIAGGGDLLALLLVATNANHDQQLWALSACGIIAALLAIAWRPDGRS